jgi:hypothetical protein
MGDGNFVGVAVFKYIGISVGGTDVKCFGFCVGWNANGDDDCFVSVGMFVETTTGDDVSIDFVGLLVGWLVTGNVGSNVRSTVGEVVVETG